MYDPTHARAGDIILVAGGSTTLPGRLLDAAIRCSEGSPFTHAAQVVDTGAGLGLIQGVATVQRAPVDQYAAHGYLFRVAGATPAEIAAVTAWLTARLGQRYGYRELLALGLALDLHLRVRRHFRHWVCSTLVSRAWAAAGAPLTWAPMPTPANLADAVSLVGPRPTM